VQNYLNILTKTNNRAIFFDLCEQNAVGPSLGVLILGLSTHEKLLQAAFSLYSNKNSSLFFRSSLLLARLERVDAVATSQNSPVLGLNIMDNI